MVLRIRGETKYALEKEAKKVMRQTSKRLINTAFVCFFVEK